MVKANPTMIRIWPDSMEKSWDRGGCTQTRSGRVMERPRAGSVRCGTAETYCDPSAFEWVAAVDVVGQVGDGAVLSLMQRWTMPSTRPMTAGRANDP